MDVSRSVIVPLYVYPSAGAWGPVYDMYEFITSFVFVTFCSQRI
jgi:hypothetical protein